MGAHDKVTLIKDMTYRGQLEEWANSYELDGTTPTTDAGWKALFDAIAASEKTVYAAPCRVVRALGYESGSDNAVATYDYLGASTTIAGTLVIGGTDRPWAGDQAGWLRMKVGMGANGKPVYIRKYFHAGASSSSSPDNVQSAWKTAALAHAALMVGGTLPGGMKWIGPNGTIGTQPAASAYVTTRTLKRRGRRPTPAP